MYASNMGLLNVLQPDLRTLSMEARKKWPVIKETAERAIMRLRSIEDQKDKIDSHAKYIEAISKTEDVLKPFLQACETKNSKMIILAVGSIQKLISHGAIATNVLPTIINVLTPLLDIGDETVQLKVLQTMLTLITSSNNLHGNALAQALGLCFRLHDSRSPSVHHTASATLRQVVTMLFDRTGTEMESVAKADREAATTVEAKAARPLLPYATDAYLFLQDLCTLTGGDPPAWLSIDHVSKALGLELIESILGSHHRLFLEIPEFSVLLKDRVCPLVIKSFKLSTAFPYVIRLQRILAIFIKNFSNLLQTECEVFLSRPVRLLEMPENPLWLHTLALEVLKELLSDPSLMSALYLSYDVSKASGNNGSSTETSGNGEDGGAAGGGGAQNNIFQSISMALATFLHYLFRQDPEVVIRVISVKARCMDMLALPEAPNIPTTYAILTALECLAGIVECMGQLANSANTPQEKATCSQLVNNAWPSINNTLSLILSKTNDEALIQSILNSYQSFANTCAALNLDKPRDTIINFLTKQALPVLKEGASDLVADIGLTMKHVLTLRVLISISQKLGDALNDSWYVILEVFDGLDRLIKSTNPIQALQQESATQVSAKGPLSAELNSLSANISDIFKNTQHLSESGVIFILSSLCKISTNALLSTQAQSAANVQLRIFSIMKIVEAVAVNIYRIDKLWPTINEHLRAVCNHKNPTIRSIGVDSLTSLITSAFTSSNVTIGKGDIRPSTAPVSEVKTPDMQVPFLEGLEELSRSSYSDTRQKTLQSLFHILQSSGQSFSKAWPLVLSILMTIAVNNDKQHIPNAFKSVQLICTDFLSNLPLDCLALYITTIGCYGLQGSDINISLTAIGLLWNIADFVAKENPALTSPKAESRHQRKIGTLSPQDKLWLSAFMEMKQLCVDGRPEVRNCALVTLFKTLTTHGVLLHYVAWAACLSDILFPLLVDVRAAAAAAAATENSPNHEIGKQGGKTVMLLVHHSRNTASKQWDETLVLALGGIVRVFKAYISTLFELPDFTKSWSSLLEQIEIFILTGSREVSGSTIQLMQDFLLTHGEKFPRPLWEVSMEMWEKVTLVLTKNADTGKTLTILSETICDLFVKLKSSFQPTDIIRVIRIMRLLALFQSDNEELSPMQKATIKLYKSLTPLTEEVTPTVVYNLLIFVAAAIGYPYKPPLPDQQDPEKLNSSGLLFTPSLSYLCIAESALSHLVDLYKTIPTSITAYIFEDLAKVVGAAMMTKYQTYLSPLWKSAVPAFISIVSIGLPALNRSEIVKNRPQLIIIWTDVADTLEDFLLHDRATLPKLSPDALKEDEELDVMLADCIAQNMLSGAAHAELLHERLLEILRAGTLLVSANRESFAQACYKNMFFLCSRGGEQDDAHSCHLVIARLATPILMRRCKEVLEKFVVDDRQSGQCPLPRCRLAEISFLLQFLYNLELQPDLEVFSEQTTTPAALKMKGTKRHLLHLFPLLCDCITTREESIKERLKAIFHEMAKAMGLE